MSLHTERRMPRPIDAVSDDPAIARVETMVDRGGGFFERVRTFPDGSAQHTFLPPASAAIPLAEPGRPAAWQALAASNTGPPTPRVSEANDTDADDIVADNMDADDTDADPWQLRTPGGSVDLTTGLLHSAGPAGSGARTTAVAPAESADCPLWRRFLAETMGETTGQTTENGAALQTFLQRFCGYALTGETCEHALLYGFGEGGNGKSVFVNTVRGIFGSYAAVAAPDLFAQGAERRAGKAHSAEVAMLAGARLVTASETEEGRVWADGRLKMLTGGDPVTARFCGRDPFTFTPRFKLIVVGNHMPVLRTVDAALRRRLCVVPFAHRPAVPDLWLEHKLRAEWPQILRWMIEGCLAWRGSSGGAGDPSGQASGDRPEGAPGGLAHGLRRPAAVAAATDAYLCGQDLVGQFLGDCCDRGDGHLETAGDLYAAWRAFARAAGEDPGSQRRFAARLERHGLTRERLHHARVYRGVRLARPGEVMDEVYRAREGEGW